MPLFDNNFELSTLIFVILATILLALIIAYHNNHSLSNRLFILLSLSFSVWSLVNYFSTHIPFGTDLIWIRWVLCTAAPQAVLFALFMRTFPDEKLTWSKKLFSFFIIILLLQMASALSPFVFKSIDTVNGNVMPVPAKGIIFYALVLVFSFAFGIYWLIRKMIISKGEERKSLITIFISFALMVFLLLTFLFFAVVLFKNTTFIPYSHLFVLPFVIGVSYTLTRQKFLNIRLVATEFLVGTLTIILMTEGLMSGSILSIIWKTCFAFFVGFLGYLLIRSVLREVKQREELQKLTEELQTANLRLKELDQQKTDFLSIASHQLRTPLTIFKGFIELLQDGAYGKPTKDMLQIYKDFDENNEHLIKLVDEFLNVSRIEQGRTKWEFKKSDINQLIGEVTHELHDKAAKKDMEIVWYDNGTPLQAVIDREKIYHVVYNYVDNAIKYSDRGKVTVTVAEEDGGLVLRVKDSGIGFDKVDGANFFQKFYRGQNTKATVNVTGTGLGIFICKRFVEGHGGRVWATSPGPGKGSEFGFWIPLNGHEEGIVETK